MSPWLYFAMSSLYVPIGVEPVARPRTESGFKVIWAAMIFAAFLLISS